MTFYPGKVGLMCFIKYLGLMPRFCIGSCVLIMVPGHDQSDKFSMLDSDNESISPDSPQE